MADAEQRDDPYELGLAAYAKKHFGEAGKLFEESAAGKARRAREASATTQELREEAIRDFRLAGDAHTCNYHFDHALLAYQQARELTSQVDHPRLWANLTMLIGNTESKIGVQTDGDRIHRHLGNAIAAYRAALTVYTKDAFPQLWAATQNNLGLVLWNQGTRTGGAEGRRLLRQAIVAYQLALQVRTKGTLPVQWEQTMENLALAEKALADMP